VVLPEFVYSDIGARIAGDTSKVLEGKSRAVTPPAESENAGSRWWLELNDSKLLKPAKREELSAIILKECRVQIAWCDPREIDEWNILHASMIAMRRALEPFSGIAQTVLVDGHLDPFNPKFRCPAGERERLKFTHVETLVKGDQRSLSIAAASIVAKVHRDRWMTDLDRDFPGYGFASHKGYSTPVHYQALDRMGPCSIHRRSFAPVRDYSSV
jgi:ribonuclease HII